MIDCPFRWNQFDYRKPLVLSVTPRDADGLHCSDGVRGYYSYCYSCPEISHISRFLFHRGDSYVASVTSSRCLIASYSQLQPPKFRVWSLWVGFESTETFGGGTCTHINRTVTQMTHWGVSERVTRCIFV